MRVAALLMFGAGLSWAPLAAAADCASAYTTDQLLGDLISVEDFLRSGDDAAAGAAAKKLEGGLGCLQEVLPPMIAGRAYRAVAAGLVASGDTDRGGAWFRTASEIEQAFEYGLEDLPEDHPVRDAYATARVEASGEQVLVEGKELVPTGTHYLDGRKLDEPRARLDRPHVYQHEAAEVRSWVLEGNAFPAEMLAVPAPVAVAEPEDDKKAKKDKKAKEPKPPKEKPEKVAKVEPEKEPKPDKVKPDRVKPEKEPKEGKVAKAATSGGSTVVLQRQRPWEKTPLLVGGGLVVAAGGGLYAMALQARGDFEGATSEPDVRSFAKQANQLVIASAAVLAVGTGTFTWGVILDGGTPLPSVNIRF